MSRRLTVMLAFGFAISLAALAASHEQDASRMSPMRTACSLMRRFSSTVLNDVAS